MDRLPVDAPRQGRATRGQGDLQGRKGQHEDAQTDELPDEFADLAVHQAVDPHQRECSGEDVRSPFADPAHEEIGDRRPGGAAGVTAGLTGEVVRLVVAEDADEQEDTATEDEEGGDLPQGVAFHGFSLHFPITTERNDLIRVIGRHSPRVEWRCNPFGLSRNLPAGSIRPWQSVKGSQ